MGVRVRLEDIANILSIEDEAGHRKAQFDQITADLNDCVSAIPHRTALGTGMIGLEDLRSWAKRARRGTSLLVGYLADLRDESSMVRVSMRRLTCACHDKAFPISNAATYGAVQEHLQRTENAILQEGEVREPWFMHQICWEHETIMRHGRLTDFHYAEFH